MQSRRKLMIIVLAVVLSLLFLGAAALLVMGFIQYFAVESELTDSKGALEQLYNRKPFPSSENLELERGNIRTIRQELADLQAAMGGGQIESVSQSPAKFVSEFWETRKGLLSRAGTTIKVDKNFDFGFGRHMKGDLPASQDVPRLTQQLKIVETLCNILFTGGISALKGVSRQEFESDVANAVPGAAAPVVRTALARRSVELDLKNTVDPSAGVIPPGKFYGCWHFVFQFSCRETALMNVLNGLASNTMFTVVNRLDIKGDELLFSRKETEAAKAASSADPSVPKEAVKSRDYRVVCGRDAQMNVTLELDVYQFAKPQVVEPEKQPGGVK